MNGWLIDWSSRANCSPGLISPGCPSPLLCFLSPHTSTTSSSACISPLLSYLLWLSQVPLTFSFTPLVLFSYRRFLELMDERLYKHTPAHANWYPMCGRRVRGKGRFDSRDLFIVIWHSRPVRCAKARERIWFELAALWYIGGRLTPSAGCREREREQLTSLRNHFVLTYISQPHPTAKPQKKEQKIRMARITWH